MPSIITTFFFCFIIAAGLAFAVYHNFWIGLLILAVGLGLTYLFLKCDALIREADEIIKKSEELISRSRGD